MHAKKSVLKNVVYNGELITLKDLAKSRGFTTSQPTVVINYVV